MKATLERSEHQLINDEFLKTGKMAKMLAHEIRNPLSRIFLSIEQLQDTDEQDLDSGFYLDMIKQSGNEIDRIMNELLGATLLGEIKLERKSLINIIRDSLAISQEKMLPKSVRITENYPNDNMSLDGDEEKLRIAFQNIIINAIESIDKENGSVGIEAIKNNNHAIVIIRDTGCGMSQEILDSLFVPFYSTKPRKLGLGLTAARNIILAHNGKIEVKSEMGKGTEVIISLPMNDK